MNISPSPSPSQFNSGCESGWTHYLDQSSFSGSQFQKAGGFVDYAGTKTQVEMEEEEEEEEDLSMVSDASSGPPHYQEDEHCLYEDGCSFSVSWAPKLANKSSKKKKSKESGREKHLDDTASSPVLNYHSKKKLTLSKDESSMEKVMDYSEGFSATDMKGKSALLQHFGFLKSSLSKNPASQKPGDFQGGSWE